MRRSDMKKLPALLTVVIVSLILCGPSFAGDQMSGIETGTITGQIKAKEKGSMADGIVFFFSETSGPPPSATKYWRIPTNGFILDEKGMFKAMLPEGKYYMGAIKRFSGGPLGPPKNGDLFFISQDEKGNPKLHRVRKNETIDIGVIAEAVPFSRETLVTEGITSVEGTIRNAKGKPVEGMLVFAFISPTMIGRPLFVSEKSDKDGKYVLRLSGGGSYYLRSRQNYGGGLPSADEAMGVYGKGQPLTLKTGTSLKGINITVDKVGVSE
jgi:hypothetical protein